ncbi:MAG: DUF1150 family protein [Alphaproteobacteria bacterium]|nr:DUF1150 family protein [Alphaproteobacteria bacterium]
MRKFESSKQSFTPEELGRFGVDYVAYIKPVIIRGQQFHIIHAADGTPIMAASERELAFATVRQNEMEPASVH